MKPVDLARTLRREATFDPAALDRGKAALMAAIRKEVQPMRRPTIVPRLPYEDVGAALSFLERAFGFREVPAARGVRADGAIDHTMVEFGDGMIVGRRVRSASCRIAAMSAAFPRPSAAGPNAASRRSFFARSTGFIAASPCFSRSARAVRAGARGRG